MGKLDMKERLKPLADVAEPGVNYLVYNAGGSLDQEARERPRTSMSFIEINMFPVSLAFSGSCTRISVGIGDLLRGRLGDVESRFSFKPPS